MSDERPIIADDDHDITESDQDTTGDMGVSSEREGPTGPGQHGTTGVRDTSPVVADPDADPDAEVAPEQSAAGTAADINPDPPIPPVSGYSRSDPRSE
ncbi:hypothetical protein NPS01_12760 [Nocardioides psychrotolerans]|uniref:Uncharacterized protein n=1 Tax=Nocardioides psychrotolerans TaxID=1005945 RepID=A0A1I3HFY2_9ACTN|nr:hypothetical protein [Nocardioides psychrotolerans]GEP37613.1 hypothetical protein NPS01_12760 [Nocardioides psychrotolerans]SFI34646.1 hypothetical protein SAMN05216561_107168 [Nocardioides psychrotolerans]